MLHMILICISLSIFCFLVIIMFVFLFFNKEKSKHELMLENIQQTIEKEQKKSSEQKSQLLMLHNSSKLTENAMKKVVNSFNDMPVSGNIFLEQNLKNLNAFSTNSLDLIKIYGSFVKVLS